MTPKQRKAKNAYERERRRLHRLHRFETAARAQGFTLVGGIDEVGRGPLAGPVVAACVVATEPLFIRGLNDSKQVRPELRVEIAETVKARATAWAIGSACVAEIDRLNIYWASVLAMERAIAALSCGAGISHHRRRTHQIVRRPARAADQRRRALRGRCGRLDRRQSASRRVDGRTRSRGRALRFRAAQRLLDAASYRGAARCTDRACITARTGRASATRSWPWVCSTLKIRRRKRARRRGSRRAAFWPNAATACSRATCAFPAAKSTPICLDGPTLVIVEVKRRDSHEFGSALGAVDARKRATLRRIAADYAQIVAPSAPIRFDVVDDRRASN